VRESSFNESRADILLRLRLRRVRGTCEISGRGYRASSRFAEINVKRAQLPAGNREACGRADPTGARAMTMLDRCIAV